MRFSDPIPESDFSIRDSFVMASSVSCIISYHTRVQHEKIILIQNLFLSSSKCDHFISFSVETKIKGQKKHFFVTSCPVMMVHFYQFICNFSFLLNLFSNVKTLERRRKCKMFNP